MTASPKKALGNGEGYTDCSKPRVRQHGAPFPAVTKLCLPASLLALKSSATKASITYQAKSGHTDKRSTRAEKKGARRRRVIVSFFQGFPRHTDSAVGTGSTTLRPDVPLTAPQGYPVRLIELRPQYPTVYVRMVVRDRKAAA